MSSHQTRPLVGISISHSPGLTTQGLDQNQLQEAVTRVARLLLRNDYNLAYGGDLRPGGYTEQLFGLCRDTHTAKFGDDDRWERRLTGYLAWPNYLELDDQQRHNLAGRCRLVRVTPKDAAFTDLPEDLPRDDAGGVEDAFRAARCLSRMREVMTTGGVADEQGERLPPLAARVLMGGKTSGFQGLMPGIFEEVLLALEQPEQISLYVLGGFGGAAGLLADALLGEPGEDQALLGLEGQQARDPGLTALVARYQQTGFSAADLPAGRYKALQQALSGAVQQLDDLGDNDSWPALQNGLTVAENRELMRSRDLAQIEALLLTGLQRRTLAAKEDGLS